MVKNKNNVKFNNNNHHIFYKLIINDKTKFELIRLNYSIQYCLAYFFLFQRYEFSSVFT